MEDDDVSILCSHGDKPISQSDLVVCFSADFNRRQLPSSHEEAIESIWSSRCSANKTLWNGSKFRLHSVSTLESGRTQWDLGLTCYKDFLGTNFSPDADLLQEMGKNVAGNLQAFMADPLGVGCVLLTSDNQIVLLKRSGECAEAPLLYDVPGGHPEPGEISGDALNASLFTPEAIVTEIFSSILREVRDEVNLPLHSLSAPLLLGVALNKHSHNRPSSEYLVRTELSGSEVTTLYNTGNQSEASESTKVHLVSHDQLMNMQQTNFWQDLAPSAKGCFLLYQDFVKRSCCTQC